MFLIIIGARDFIRAKVGSKGSTGVGTSKE